MSITSYYHKTVSIIIICFNLGEPQSVLKYSIECTAMYINTIIRINKMINYWLGDSFIRKVVSNFGIKSELEFGE